MTATYEKKFMNPNTGSVDTLEGWGFDTPYEACEAGLVEVEMGMDGNWTEVC